MVQKVHHSSITYFKFGGILRPFTMRTTKNIFCGNDKSLDWEF